MPSFRKGAFPPCAWNQCLRIPIRAGRYTDIIKVGRTSVTVKVEVYAERLTKLCNNIAKITEAELVYVALGEDKKPITLEESRARFAQCCSLETGDSSSCS